jgi:hypothetical protein
MLVATPSPALPGKGERADRFRGGIRSQKFDFDRCLVLSRAMRLDEEATTLWRPVGPEELELIRRTGMRAFPPRLPEQPIFYPVLSEQYAVKIARDWNVPASGSGHVTRFRVRQSFLNQYEVREAGGKSHLEYWIPAEDIDAFNAAIIGAIELVHSFP